MAGFRSARTLVAFICIAVLLWCTAIAPSSGHPELALPALLFCFLAVCTPSRLRVPSEIAAAQPISLLSLHTSRAPPLA